MQTFSEDAHKDALLKRRIKFVVEKGAIARLFKAKTSSSLQQELFRRLKPYSIVKLRSRDEYDSWLLALVEDNCWEQYSRHGLLEDRWAYFAKLINIVIYEISSNRELLSEADWQRLRPWLHLPLDRNVFSGLHRIAQEFPLKPRLKGMDREEYWAVQNAARKLAERHGIPSIWFEDEWAAPSQT